MADPDEQRPAHERKLSLAETATAVLWSFFGIRKGKDYARDAARLNPIHVVVMGVIGAALFVLLLVTIVRIVVH